MGDEEKKSVNENVLDLTDMINMMSNKARAMQEHAQRMTNLNNTLKDFARMEREDYVSFHVEAPNSPQVRLVAGRQDEEQFQRLYQASMLIRDYLFVEMNRKHDEFNRLSESYL